jgi:hypothetical protein
MDPREEQTERYLKEFRPQAIREFPAPPQSASMSRRRWAAAAVFVTCVAGMFWFGLRRTTRQKAGAFIYVNKAVVVGPSQQLSTFAMTALALQDEKKFEALLDEESRKSLPRFQGEHSALRVLAKD